MRRAVAMHDLVGTRTAQHSRRSGGDPRQAADPASVRVHRWAHTRRPRYPRGCRYRHSSARGFSAGFSTGCSGAHNRADMAGRGRLCRNDTRQWQFTPTVSRRRSDCRSGDRRRSRCRYCPASRPGSAGAAGRWSQSSRPAATRRIGGLPRSAGRRVDVLARGRSGWHDRTGTDETMPRRSTPGSVSWISCFPSRGAAPPPCPADSAPGKPFCCSSWRNGVTPTSSSTSDAVNAETKWPRSSPTCSTSLIHAPAAGWPGAPSSSPTRRTCR